ncbi:MAG: triose-phosphate isomerase, partial [Planctomycetes bacterium]|nr:triose-phosphate isomerase [Planctomycetota bacterium]
HSVTRLSPPHFEVKGDRAFTEHYSVIGPEVERGPQGETLGEHNDKFVEMLKDVGCRYVIIGHSERRHVMGEDDQLINKKLHAIIQGGLEAILCIGELLSDREQNQTEKVVERQLRQGLVGIDAQDMSQVTIAYEPVWAIGTGKTASPAQAQEAHAFSREIIADIFEGSVADQVRIQYGGSVKPENAEELLGQKDVDGALVGGASLKAESFAGIIKAGLTV